MLCHLLKTPGHLKGRAFANLRSGGTGARISVAKQMKQPCTAVNYSEAKSQANQDYDRTSKKELLYHNNRRALARLLAGFRGRGSLGHSVLIYSGQAFAMLDHPGLLLSSPPFSSFLFGFPGGRVLVRKLIIYHLIS